MANLATPIFVIPVQNIASLTKVTHKVKLRFESSPAKIYMQRLKVRIDHTVNEQDNLPIGFSRLSHKMVIEPYSRRR